MFSKQGQAIWDSLTTADTSKDLKLEYVKATFIHLTCVPSQLDNAAQRFSSLTFWVTAGFEGGNFIILGYVFNYRPCLACKLVILSLGSMFVAEINTGTTNLCAENPE